MSIDKKPYAQLKTEGYVDKYLTDFIRDKVHKNDKDVARDGIEHGDFHWEQELRWYIVGREMGNNYKSKL